ncbi:hypothetical protein GC169_12105 [bacterium]|nr:hypothetical protein [bacterium]
MSGRFPIAASLVAGVLLAACQSPAAETARADEKVDPRQGEEVRQICFTSMIRNWRELDDDSILVERGVKDVYKLELLGTCQPDDAFLSVGLVQRGGSSCLQRGDNVVTDSRFDGSCVIRRIYKWNDEATPADAGADAGSAK